MSEIAQRLLAWAEQPRTNEQSGLNYTLAEAAAYLYALESQRGELLAALKRVVNSYDEYRRRGVMPAPAEYQFLVQEITDARAAIAKVEGEKG